MLDQPATAYVPPRSDWERAQPEDVGVDGTALAAAVDYARSIETRWSRDLSRPAEDQMNEPPPYNEIVGPMQPRGEQSGIVLRRGKIVAEWGTPGRVDMTFSATKSYLSLCLGLAFDRGLIPNLDAPVREQADPALFDLPQTRPITWRMLFQQTSEWSGELWGKPDWLDHHRHSALKGTKRAMRQPGNLVS